MLETIAEKRAEELSVLLIKAKKEKKWIGDGKGNLVENKAVDDAISTFFFTNGAAILEEAKLSYLFQCDVEKIQALYDAIRREGLAKAKAHLWKA